VIDGIEEDRIEKVLADYFCFELSALKRGAGGENR